MQTDASRAGFEGEDLRATRGAVEHPVGQQRISGCPHSSQACLPKALGRVAICLRVSRMASSTARLQELQRAETPPEGFSSPTSQRGQTMVRGLEAGAEPLTLNSFPSINCHFPGPVVDRECVASGLLTSFFRKLASRSVAIG